MLALSKHVAFSHSIFIQLQFAFRKQFANEKHKRERTAVARKTTQASSRQMKCKRKKKREEKRTRTVCRQFVIFVMQTRI